METRDRMEQALRQFETALAQVEEACAAVLADVGDAASLHAENERLRSTCETLEKKVSGLQARAADLAEINRQAMVRIDAAMDRIRRVLGEEA